MTITLTTIGSRNVTIDIEPAALPEAAAGSRSTAICTTPR